MSHLKRKSPGLGLAVELAAQGFAREVTPELVIDAKNHLTQDGTVLTIRHWLKDIGFLIYRLIEPDILYVIGVHILPQYQGQGLAQALISDLAYRLDAVYLALRTQSPLMWRAGSSLCRRGQWYPNPHRDLPAELTPIVAVVATKIDSVYPVHIGQYGGPLYGKKPVHHDPALQTWWDSICNFERGDAVVCVGELPKRASAYSRIGSW